MNAIISTGGGQGQNSIVKGPLPRSHSSLPTPSINVERILPGALTPLDSTILL